MDALQYKIVVCASIKKNFIIYVPKYILESSYLNWRFKCTTQTNLTVGFETQGLIFFLINKNPT